MSNSSSVQLMSKRETNWFRGIAAVMIVLSHYAEWWNWFTPTEGNAEVFRLALTKLGVYGVDIFFLFSGYAMVKSLGQERMYPGFVWKRIKNVYIPYFIVVGIIELLSGGFSSARDFWNFASGYDYWYMAVLFVFYIGFIAVYTIMEGKGPRVVTFCIFTYIFSHVLYNKGMYDFWYMSNIAFAMGVIAGEYETSIKKTLDKMGIPILLVLAVGMLFVIRSGLEPKGMEEEGQLWIQIGATLVWTLFIMTLAAKLRIKDKILAFIGEQSLYIYLTHTYIFMRCVNNFKLDYIWIFVISAILTVAVSFVLHYVIDALMCRVLEGNNGKSTGKMI